MRFLLAVEIVFSILLLCSNSCAGVVQGRCIGYASEVRRAHFASFGTDYPWHYAIGQLQQESNCRNVISNDGVGSQGVSQVTWKVWKDSLLKNGVPDLSSPRNQIKAQAIINKQAYDQAKPKKLWISYQIYNGGGLVNKEVARAGKPFWEDARKECRRKIVVFNKGTSKEVSVSACEINYDYSKKLFKYGDQYRVGPDSTNFQYW